MIAEYSLHTISKILDGMACGPILNFHGIIIAEIRVVINMNKIIAYRTHICIFDYNLGDKPVIENTFSIYDME